VTARASGLALAAALLSGCGMLPHAPIPEVEEGVWPQERDAATRRIDLYDGFEHRADLWTVRLTPAVREERVRRLAAWLHWPPSELEARLALERSDAAKWDEFIVFLYTADRKWNDLDAPESIWRIEFDMGGGEEVVGRAQAVERNATFDALFPMGRAFDTAYRVRFPRYDAEIVPRSGMLRFSSALGEMQLPYTPGSKPVPAPRRPD
jgi:hypothetical protein